ncbi:MAG: hypothetical protein HY820_42850 [Acidobacteria bacterium]|nr:hypothetical protein [Acidobacteriota bacterium]
MNREIEITIDMSMGRRRGGRPKKASPPPAKEPERIPRISRLMALAIKFQDMVDSGEVRDYADLARLGFVTRARLTQLMNLSLLAPDIQMRLLEAKSTTMSSERHLRPVIRHAEWWVQRAAFTGRLPAAGAH